MVEQALFSSNTDDWGTPRDYFNKLEKIYNFEIDAAADQFNHLCCYWFGEGGLEEDALDADWARYTKNLDAVFWLNPPYSKSKEFLEKVVIEYNKGCNIVVLIPARTDTRYWHKYVEGIAVVKNIKGRLKFNGAKNSAPFPSVLLKYLHE